MKIVNYISEKITNGLRIFKVNGRKTENVNVISPFGVDSIPPKNTQLFSITIGDYSFTIGSISKPISDLKEGESCLYSSDGDVQATVKARINGDIELNGDNDNLVRYTKLLEALNNQDTLLNTEFTKISTTMNEMVKAFNSLAFLLAALVASE